MRPAPHEYRVRSAAPVHRVAGRSCGPAWHPARHSAAPAHPAGPADGSHPARLAPVPAAVASGHHSPHPTRAAPVVTRAATDGGFFRLGDRPPPEARCVAGFHRRPRAHRPALAGRYLVWESWAPAASPAFFCKIAKPWPCTTPWRPCAAARAQAPGPLVEPAGPEPSAPPSSARWTGTLQATSRCCGCAPSTLAGVQHAQFSIMQPLPTLVQALNAFAPPSSPPPHGGNACWPTRPCAARCTSPRAKSGQGGECLGGAARAHVAPPAPERRAQQLRRLGVLWPWAGNAPTASLHLNATG